MNTYVEVLVNRNRQRGIIVDTNLLLVLIVGRIGIDQLPNFRATRIYDETIFALTSDIVASFTRIHTTSQIVTELDNLARQVRNVMWPAVASQIRATLNDLSEVRYESATLAASELYPGLGITDCSIIELAREYGGLVITEDLALTSSLERVRHDVINVSRLVR